MATVKVRVAVVMTTDGAWFASGWSDAKSDEAMIAEAEAWLDSGEGELEDSDVFFLEAERTVPEKKNPEVVQATVMEA